MKKTISIGAVLIAVTVAFLYVPRAPLAPQTISQTIANATFKVGGTAYSTTVRPNETVIEAMRALASLGTFTFTGRDYPGLGFFVDSINGEKDGNGTYWMLYINGVSAATGASSAIVHAGDVVEWKYEKK